MNFTVLPVSSLAGYRLRHLAGSDVPAWFGYLSRREVFEHTSWSVSSPDALLPFVWSPETNTPDRLLRLAVVRADDDALVGTIGFHTVSAANSTAEIAFDLMPAVWGRGIAASLCRAVVDWGHRHVGLVRIQATVLHSNARSQRVLERCGFEREGLLRSYRRVGGTPGDFFMYAHVEVQPEQAGPK
jgi:ribosomal-protein-alanine N-acetyltransferase